MGQMIIRDVKKLMGEGMIEKDEKNRHPFCIRRDDSWKKWERGDVDVRYFCVNFYLFRKVNRSL